jgi:hypothetical protein
MREVARDANRISQFTVMTGLVPAIHVIIQVTLESRGCPAEQISLRNLRKLYCFGRA